MTLPHQQLIPLALIGSLSLSACASTVIPTEAQLLKFTHSAIGHRYYDGNSNDLLTAGLGLKGLQNPLPPKLSDKQSISIEELRQLAIHTNYRGIVSTLDATGFGRLYGPQPLQPAIAGHEYSSQSYYPDGQVAASFVVQIPDSFDPKQACIIAAPSSGSRGVWGAIGTAGDWGLRHGCVVAYTDKGTGTGFEYQDNGQSYTIQGQLTTAVENWITPSNKAASRVKTRHAHNQKNPEKQWGVFTLQAVKMAFYLLNKHHRQADQFYRRDNTLVISSSISNGGNSVLRSAEADTQQWIDGVVASEPTIILPESFKFTVSSNNTLYSGSALDILAVSNTMALYQPCALLSENPQASVFTAGITALKSHLEQRCQNLLSHGLLKPSNNEDINVAKLAKQSREVLLTKGLTPASYSLQSFGVSAKLWPALSTNYSNSFGGYSFEEQLCGLSYSAVDAQQQAVLAPQSQRRKVFSLSSGIPPTAGIDIVRNDNYSWYASNNLGSKQNLDPSFNALLCLNKHYQKANIQQGIKDAQFSANFNNIPTIIIHGVKDSLVFINHNSRALMAYRAEKFPERGNVHYYEIDNAQHFDSLLSLPEFGQKLVPLHYYYEQAMELMWQHLRNKQPLPPHQRVNSKVSSLPLNAADLPAIKFEPDAQAIIIKPAKVILPH